MTRFYLKETIYKNYKFEFKNHKTHLKDCFFCLGQVSIMSPTIEIDFVSIYFYTFRTPILLSHLH